MYFWYYNTIDRFAITEAEKRPPIDDVRRSVYYCGIEYYRYIPLEGLSLDPLVRILINEPREICLEITRACNLMCPICIAAAGPHLDTYLPLPEVEETIGKFDGSIMRVNFTGGEPILHPDFVDFVRIAVEMAEGVVIATDGYEPVKLEDALRGKRNLTVSVSLHGTREVQDRFVGKTGSFDNAVDTIKRCLEQGHRVEVLTTAFVDAIKSLAILLEYLECLPIGEHRINLVKPRGRVERESLSWEAATSTISRICPCYKLGVKRKHQPFLFVSSNGSK